MDKTLDDAELLQANGKHTPYRHDVKYHAQNDDDNYQPESVVKYKQLVGERSYLVDCTRNDISYMAGKLGAAIDKPAISHWRMTKSMLRYLAQTRKYFICSCKRHDKHGGVRAAVIKRRIKSSVDADSAMTR